MVTPLVRSRFVHVRAGVAGLALAATLAAAAPAAANILSGVTNTNLVVTYDTSAPAILIQQAIPRGLQPGE